MTYSLADHVPVATLDDTARGDFIVQVYQHLVAAVVVFIGIEALFITSGIAEGIYDLVAGNGMAWLLILGAFMIGQEGTPSRFAGACGEASQEWARQDSNLRPWDYESPALTAELRARVASVVRPFPWEGECCSPWHAT